MNDVEVLVTEPATQTVPTSRTTKSSLAIRRCLYQAAWRLARGTVEDGAGRGDLHAYRETLRRRTVKLLRADVSMRTLDNGIADLVAEGVFEVRARAYKKATRYWVHQAPQYEPKRVKSPGKTAIGSHGKAAIDTRGTCRLPAGEPAGYLQALVEAPQDTALLDKAAEVTLRDAGASTALVVVPGTREDAAARAALAVREEALAERQDGTLPDSPELRRRVKDLVDRYSGEDMVEDGHALQYAYSVRISAEDRIVALDYALGKARAWNRRQNEGAIHYFLSVLQKYEARRKEVEKLKREAAQVYTCSCGAHQWRGRYGSAYLDKDGKRVSEHADGIVEDHHLGMCWKKEKDVLGYPTKVWLKPGERA